MSRFHALAGTKQLPAKSEERALGANSPEGEFGSQSSVVGQNEEPERDRPSPLTDDPWKSPTGENRQPITDSRTLVDQFLSLSEEDVLETIKNDPALLEKFKKRMGKKKAPAKGKSNVQG